jgi:hypothetical protein
MSRLRLLVEALLVLGLIACSSTDPAKKSEAAALSRAIEALREAPNSAKNEALSNLRGLPCSDAEICAAQSACVAGYEGLVRALEDVESGKALAAAPSANRPPDDQKTLTETLARAQASLERSKPLTEKCATAQGELIRKYKL